MPNLDLQSLQRDYHVKSKKEITFGNSKYYRNPEKRDIHERWAGLGRLHGTLELGRGRSWNENKAGGSCGCVCVGIGLN